MSRRRSDKMSPRRMRLQRGAPRDLVTPIDGQPIAALDVMCDGRDGYTCGRLMRFEHTADGEQVYDVATIPVSVHCTEDDDGNFTFTCRCGRPSGVVRWAVVSAFLSGMVERREKSARVSAARLAAIPPSAH